MVNNSYHIPVLLKEVTGLLITEKAGVYFDGTLGGGSYSHEFLNTLEEGAIIVATDLDINSIEYCKNKFNNEKRIKIINDNFSNIKNILSDLEINSLNGAVLDLGVSSYQFDDNNSGFSYRYDQSFDMRFDKSRGTSAEEYINELPQEDLIHLLKEFGEEREAKRIVRKIIDFRVTNRITKTRQVYEIIEKIIPKNKLNETMSRVFQAFRIFVNDELNNLRHFLDDVIELLIPGGRCAIVSYHSLEDRIIKNFVNYQSLDCICPKDFPVCRCEKKASLKKMHRKVIISAQEEIDNNIRARSAKLRVFEKI